MYKEIHANSKEQLEDEIMFLEDHCEAKVVEKPHTWNKKEWWATVDMPRKYH